MDELASAVAPASIPELARDLGVGSEFAAGAVLVAFFALALVVEAPLLAWSERVRVRWFSAVSMLVLAVDLAWLAWAPNVVCLLAGLAVYGVASGCTTTAAEGALVEADPSRRERTMTRLMIAASVGDFLAPVMLAGLAAIGLGWRAGFAVGAIVALVLAIAHVCSKSLDRTIAPEEDEESAAESGFLASLRVALRNRALMGWSLATAASVLVDEVFVAFVAIHLDAIGATVGERSFALGAWVVAGFVALLGLERFADRVDGRRVLVGASAVGIGATVTLALTTSPVLATVMIALSGACGATFHPLTKARSYGAAPGRPGLVNAVASAFTVVDLGAPIVFGLVSARLGTVAAMLALLATPLTVGAVALVSLKRAGHRAPK
ncbi:MAG: MFS transporter [Polyangiaceae bacterium]